MKSTVYPRAKEDAKFPDAFARAGSDQEIARELRERIERLADQLDAVTEEARHIVQESKKLIQQLRRISGK